MKTVRLVSCLCVLFLTVIGGCATNPVTGKQNFVLMSEEQEVDLGKQYSGQVMQQYQEYKDPELTALVNRLGAELSANSHRSNLEYHFTVLDSPEVNAFALPGGYIYITRGIVAYMNSEEELAGVLGHEIGHVTARHSVRQHAASTTAGLLGAVATIATGSQGVGQLSGQLSGALVSGYGRGHELEADRLGAEYLARTGYDPEMMLEVVGILKDQEEFEIQRAKEEGRQPRTYHGVFASHPRNDDRLQEVVKAAEKFSNPNAKRTDPERFIKMLEGVTFGDSEEQGIIRGNRFYHLPLDFRVEFPAGWRIENGQDQLVSVKPDESAVFLVRLDKRSGNESPGAYLRRTFDNLKQGRAVDNDSYTGLIRGKNPFGTGTLRVAATVQDNNVFVVYGAARNQIPESAFFDTVRSIRHLDSRDRALAVERRIKVIRAGRGDTFASLARRVELGKYTESQLRLLNGMYPDGEPRAGKLVKIVQ